MESLQRKNFDSPDETRPMPNGEVAVVDLGDVKAMRTTFQPGWRWSQNVRPTVGTDSCQVHHIGYQLAGRLVVRADDGSEQEYGPGDVYNIHPGHDAWVVGDEPVVMVDFRGAETYAKPHS